MSFANNSRRNLSGIQKSLSRLQDSVLGTRKSAESISKSLRESNIQKRKGIADSAKFFQMRRESVRRREREDLVEASTSRGVARSSTTAGVMRSTKGFFGRIMDYLGNILIGWAVVNLPRITKFSEDLTKRLQKYKGILDEFFSGTISLFTNFGTGLGEVLTSISNFDFVAMKESLNITIGKMNESLSKMRISLEQGISMLSQDTQTMLERMGFKISDFQLPGSEEKEQKQGQQLSSFREDPEENAQLQEEFKQSQIQPITGELTNIVPLENLMANNSGEGPVGRTTGYGFSEYHGRHHAGIDIGTSGQKGFFVSIGLVGTVSFVGNLQGYGKTVIINSGDLDFLFAHLASFNVKRGQKYEGQIIGEIGDTGMGTGIHLQFEVRKKGGAAGSDVDPNPYVQYLKIGKLPPKTTNIDSKIDIPNLETESQTETQTNENENENLNPLDNIFNLFGIQSSRNTTRAKTIARAPNTKGGNTVIINSGNANPPEPPSQNNDSGGGIIPFQTASVNSTARLFELQQLTKLG